MSQVDLIPRSTTQFIISQQKHGNSKLKYIDKHLTFCS